jgi:hypothetical protein
MWTVVCTYVENMAAAYIVEGIFNKFSIMYLNNESFTRNKMNNNYNNNNN